MKLNSVFDNKTVQLFKDRKNLEKYYSLLKKKRYKDSVRKTIQLIHEYFTEHEDTDYVDPTHFVLWCDSHSKFNDSDTRFNVLELINSDDALETQEELTIVKRLNDELRAQEIKDIISSFEAGKVSNLHEQIKGQTEAFENTLAIDNFDIVKTKASELFSLESQVGIKFKLSCLHDYMRDLQPGDFGIIAARPDNGKTSFIADQIVHFSKQEKCTGSILWLNNEGINDKIKQRCIQSALGKDLTEIVQMIQNNEDVDGMYEEITNGGDNKIVIAGIHNRTSSYIENLIKFIKPSVVIFDMIDNVVFNGLNHLGGQRTDQILETMYQWARSQAVLNNCIILATSQVSSDGEGMAFPRKDMLKDSKTGKQGACDFIIMIGRKDDTTQRRYISLPKNKLAVPGMPIDPRAEVHFDHSKCKFNEKVIGAFSGQEIDIDF